MVFGRQAADTAAELVKPNSPPVQFPEKCGERTIARFDQLRHATGPIPTSQLRVELQRTMQAHAPVYRNSKDMLIGVDKVGDVMKKFKDVGVKDKTLIWNTDLIETFELENLLSQGYQLMVGAENRKESRGAQAHEDFPERDDENWMKHTLTWQTDPLIENAKMEITYRPVVDKPLDDEMHEVPPAKRVY